MHRKDNSGGTGDVIFKIDEWYDNKNQPRIKELGFLCVRNPKEVEGILKSLAKKGWPDTPPGKNKKYTIPQSIHKKA